MKNNEFMNEDYETMEAEVMEEYDDLGDFLANADEDAIRAEHGLSVPTVEGSAPVELVEDDDEEDEEYYPDFEVCDNFYGAKIVTVNTYSVVVESVDGVKETFQKDVEFYGEYISISVDTAELHNMYVDFFGNNIDWDSLKRDTVYPYGRVYKLYMPKPSDVDKFKPVETPKTIHNRICSNFGVVESAFYDICKDLKTIRDSKYYKFLGYKTFEKYCKDEFSMTSRNAYSYITVAENLTQNFVKTSSQIGISKLSTLAKLEEDTRTELLKVVDINKISARDLEKKAKELKKQAKEEEENRTHKEEDCSLMFCDWLEQNCPQGVKSLDDVLTWCQEIGNCFSRVYNVTIPVDGDECDDIIKEKVKLLRFMSEYGVNMSKCCNSLLKAMGEQSTEEDKPKPKRTRKPKAPKEVE